MFLSQDRQEEVRDRALQVLAFERLDCLLLSHLLGMVTPCSVRDAELGSFSCLAAPEFPPSLFN